MNEKWLQDGWLEFLPFLPYWLIQAHALEYSRYGRYTTQPAARCSGRNCAPSWCRHTTPCLTRSCPSRSRTREAALQRGTDGRLRRRPQVQRLGPPTLLRERGVPQPAATFKSRCTVSSARECLPSPISILDVGSSMFPQCAKKSPRLITGGFRNFYDQWPAYWPISIVSRNSMLLRVFFSLFSISSIASTGGTPVSARRSMTTRPYSSG